MRSIILSFLFVYFLFYPLVALASQIMPRFERLSLEDGLSQNVVNSILQDHEGFLWFATQDGLNRYDGYTFKVFRHDPQDPSSLSDNWAQVLFQDSQGRLWIGTHGGGLNRFDADSERFVRFEHNPTDPHSLSSDRIVSLVEDRQGHLWIATEGGGLNKFDETSGQFSHYRHAADQPNSVSGDKLWTLFLDSRGVLWLGSSGGLDRFNPKQQNFSHFSPFSDQHSLSEKQSEDNSENQSYQAVKRIIEDADGNLWVGSTDGLSRFDWQQETFVSFKHQNSNPNSLSHNNVSALLMDSDGTLWVGSDNGLNRFDAARQQFVRFHYQITDAHSLAGDLITTIYQDNHGTLWVGTRSGLNKYDRQNQRFGHVRHQPLNPNSLSHNGVWSLYKDKQGALWVGTSNGLNKFDGQQVEHFKHQPDNPNSLSHNAIGVIFQDTNGLLWFGSDGGLNQYNPQTGTFVHFKHQSSDPNSLSDNAILSIHQDANGTLWIGTLSGGLNRFNRQAQNFSHYKHQKNNPNSLSHDSVSAISEDSKGTLWIGTYEGLNRFNPHTGEFKRYQHLDTDLGSLSHNGVNAIHEDSRGTLWIGTDGGLNRLSSKTGKNQHFRHYREKNGLPNDMVLGIVEDKAGQLWLSTNHGLSRFDPGSESWRNFDSFDGLQSNEFNQGSYFKAADGELFFGGINGFNHFYPESIQDTQQTTPVVLTDFLLLNQSVPIEPQKTTADASIFTLPKAINLLDHLTLGYQQNLVSFEFAALHFANPMKNRYAYQLQGQDQAWIYTDAKNRRATYTNLPAGEHILRIKAANSYGDWNEQGKSLKITVLPPPWQTRWAYALYILLPSALLLIFIRGQRKKIENKHAQNQRLERKVNERTASLTTKNQELAQKKDEMEQKNRELIATQQQLVHAEKMASLGTLTAGVAHEINNPTHFVQMSAENLETALHSFQQFLFDLTDKDTDAAIIESFETKFKPFYNHLVTIKDGTQRIKIIVQSLRVFSQLDAAEQKTVKITDLLQATINLVQTQYQEVSEFVTDFTADPELYCYPAQLNQVFMNLIVNACDALRDRQSQPGDHPDGQIIIGCRQNDDAIEITVKDNGSGMSDETKNKLFEPFYTTKRVGEGTGLGLSVSFGIVQKHGGELTVESELGVGSSFLLRLPVVWSVRES